MNYFNWIRLVHIIVEIHPSMQNFADNDISYDFSLSNSGKANNLWHLGWCITSTDENQDDDDSSGAIRCTPIQY